ncbi:hypothetical protein NQ315_002001 [Exocentrus adspersus]|uniref:Protein phosphatase 1 regulatory subunit 35 C-terminal domain-containing protein n=1 Tax=Exocentrus adspersus TaxID=1586481 RepID=A0AAV8WAT9_9CUCU|nr:hypothetical protein NQ315_002001 [Exocentrus adspersus]
MNKQKVDCKKTLVRNPEKPVAKSKVIVESKSRTSVKTQNTVGQKRCDNPVKRSQISKTDLDLPELYSTLKISKEIDDTINRRTKSCSDDKVLTIDDKIAKKVNFPYNKSVYKGLVPLGCAKATVQSLPHPRSPFPQKDEIPVLSDFVTPREELQEKYFHAPKVKIDNKPSIVTDDNLRLYRILHKYDNWQYEDC